MNIVLTGANGFVGKYLCSYLSRKKYQVIACSRANEKQINLSSSSITFINYVDLEKNLSNADVIIHLAGRAHVINDIEHDPYIAYRDVNVLHTINVAKLALFKNVKRFIYISSVKVIGEESLKSPFTEKSNCFPSDHYGNTKLEAEILLQKIFENTNTTLVIIRPPLIYGPGVKGNFQTLIRLCQRPIPLPFGRVKNLRSFVNLDNLCSFILLCCQHPNAANQTFLISDDEDVSTTALITSIKQALGKQPWLVPIPSQSLDALFRVLGKKNYSERLLGNLQVDITKAKTVLGWQPVTRFQAGIQSMVDAEC